MKVTGQMLAVRIFIEGIKSKHLPVGKITKKKKGVHFS